MVDENIDKISKTGVCDKGPECEDDGLELLEGCM